MHLSLCIYTEGCISSLFFFRACWQPDNSEKALADLRKRKSYVDTKCRIWPPNLGPRHKDNPTQPGPRLAYMHRYVNIYIYIYASIAILAQDITLVMSVQNGYAPPPFGGPHVLPFCLNLFVLHLLSLARCFLGYTMDLDVPLLLTCRSRNRPDLNRAALVDRFVVVMMLPMACTATLDVTLTRIAAVDG